MDFTTDKLRSLVRKWQTLIEAHVDVKTTDNYTLRMFCIAFTKRRANQVKRTCYAQSSQIRQVRILCFNSSYWLLLISWTLITYFRFCLDIRFAVKWGKLWLKKLRLVIWKNWWQNLFLRWLVERLRRLHPASIHFKMSSSVKSRSWRRPNLILASWWRYVPPDPLWNFFFVILSNFLKLTFFEPFSPFSGF